MSQLFVSAGQSTSFNFISPSTEYSGLISFRMDWLDLLAVQGTLSVQKHQFFGGQAWVKMRRWLQGSSFYPGVLIYMKVEEKKEAR